MHPSEYKVRGCMNKRKITDEGMQDIIITAFCREKPNIKTKIDKITYCFAHMGIFAQYVHECKQIFENIKKNGHGVPLDIPDDLSTTQE